MLTDDAKAMAVRFDGLIREHQKSILNYLNRMVSHSAVAEELAQEVFVRAYLALPRLPLDANHRAWLYRIATNLAYDHLRHRRLLQWLPLSDRDTPSSPSLEARSDEGESQAVHAALDKLKPDHRAVLLLFSAEGYSVREIAQTLEISEGAVKTRLFRAREQFRHAYSRGDSNALL